MNKDIESNNTKTLRNDAKLLVKTSKPSNVVHRLFFGVIMLSLYLYITAKDEIFSVIISLALTIGITYELISITKKNSGDYPINSFLVFSIASIVFSQKVIPALAVFYPSVSSIVQLSNLKPILFTLYVILLISTVTKLKRKTLKHQLLLMTIVHVSSYIGGVTCAMSIQIISYGRFFYVYTSLLVIGNDIFAYFIGKLFGRTPLICLSPNKTVEGFVGGFVFTFLLGLLLSFLKLKGRFLYDSAHSNLELPVSLEIDYLNFPLMYLHNIAFVFAASFLAPFCGFIASAIKRSFQKKDFGSIIPGHGGITDRFDCQILMTCFTFYYLRVFANQSRSSASLIYKFLIDNLKEEDLSELCKILKTVN